jgi:hypothetical protein
MSATSMVGIELCPLLSSLVKWSLAILNTAHAPIPPSMFWGFFQLLTKYLLFPFMIFVGKN